MKRTNIASLFIFGLLAFTATTALAQVDVSVVGGDNLNFGKLSAPSDFAAVWTLSALDGSLSKTGGNSFDFGGGTHNRGSFIISGNADAGVSYDVAVTPNFTGLGLSLTTSTPKTSPGSPWSLDNQGSLTVFVGGVLTIGTNAIAGSYNDAMITITVNYYP